MQLLLEERLNTGSLSQEVGVFVELLWTEALGRLGNILRVPIHKLSLNDVRFPLLPSASSPSTPPRGQHAYNNAPVCGVCVCVCA